MSLGFLAGILAIQLSPRLPTLAELSAGGVVAGLLVLGLYLRPPADWLRRGAIGLTAALFGFLFAAGRAELRLSEFLPAELEGQDIPVVGVIESLPQSFERGQRFLFHLEEAPVPLPSRLSLAWYRSFREGQAPGPGEIRAGERWHLTVRLKRPHGNLNPHGFDYEGWLLEQGVRATGYVRSVPDNRRLAAFVPGPGAVVERLRETIRARFQQALPDAPYSGVLVALAIGDQRAIHPDLWRIFARSGISHLVAISGMHVTMIAALCAGVVGWGWRRLPGLALRMPAQQAAVVAGFVTALGYCLLAGWGVPAQRTLYMLGCVALALVLRRETAPTRVLALALAVVLLMDPWAVTAAGFWLSFGAVGLLFLVGSGRLATEGRLRQALRTQWAVTLGLIPVLLLLFQQFSLVSPLANALAIPLVSFVVTPLALVFAILPFQIFADLAHGAFALTMVPVRWLAELPWATWQQAAPPVPLALVACLGCLWALLPCGTPVRATGLLALAPLLLWAPPRPAPGEALVTVLDVGQGLAVHVQTASRDLLYDTGPAFSSDANSGDRILLPYLRAVGVRSLDVLVVTHQDTDHAGGAEAVLSGLPVGEVYSVLPVNHPVRLMAGLRNRACAADLAWQWDGVVFRVVHPPEGAEPLKGRDNETVCVIQMEVGGQRLLLTSDMEAATESRLVSGEGRRLVSQVVIAPHHGSRTSSSPAFVAAVAPQWVIFPVGYRNRFRHPNPDVWTRWAVTGAGLLRTDASGAVRFQMGGGTISPVGWREVRPRYWHGR
ncbi:DNA internalization-related competence protein ComEC/Rec2 [Zoogloea sp.]|uniref:DNA internalization-related competence protein ComEC/Rec2 n=1 Tax=Zoogloea sp. TaxID=49181 RepID=UPI0026061FC6|nr:DNA internalization-related competence protein ComEC/Rec2 [Zoogloea sp.]MDD3352872.1 DNA internalization-related competence protein ComEC/Rec2 [Zoogloea sp.]